MRLLWSQSVPAPLRGLSLIREREWALVLDGRDGLFLCDRTGAIQAQRPAPLPAALACAAEDGSACAVAGAQSPVLCWLAPDLASRWQRQLPQRATALAMEPLGRFVAVADAGGTLHLIDAQGQTVWRARTPRPLRQLVFVPEKAVLVGAADLGLVVCFGATGECLWRDGLVAHVGGLTADGRGDRLLLACFGDGLYRYGTAGPQQQRIPLDASCQLAALSYAGDLLLTAGPDNRLCLRDGEGDIRDQFALDNPAVALGLGATGDYGVVGLANGSVLRLEMTALTAPSG